MKYIAASCVLPHLSGLTWIIVESFLLPYLVFRWVKNLTNYNPSIPSLLGFI